MSEEFFERNLSSIAVNGGWRMFELLNTIDNTLNSIGGRPAAFGDPAGLLESFGEASRLMGRLELIGELVAGGHLVLVDKKSADSLDRGLTVGPQRIGETLRRLQGLSVESLDAALASKAVLAARACSNTIRDIRAELDGDGIPDLRDINARLNGAYMSAGVVELLHELVGEGRAKLDDAGQTAVIAEFHETGLGHLELLAQAIHACTPKRPAEGGSEARAAEGGDDKKYVSAYPASERAAEKAPAAVEIACFLEWLASGRAFQGRGGEEVHLASWNPATEMWRRTGDETDLIRRYLGIDTAGIQRERGALEMEIARLSEMLRMADQAAGTEFVEEDRKC
jgi:hypothetical protein